MKKRNKITIVGLGMMGASIALAVRKKGIFDNIVGCDNNSDHLKLARDKGVIDAGYDDIKNAIRMADLIIIAVPIRQYDSVMNKIAPHITDSQIITDVGSVKLEICENAKKILKNRINQFVPGHPLAGSEKSGISAANEDLFEDQRVVLTPTSSITEKENVEQVMHFWKALHAKVTLMSPEEHDEIVAVTSHLPHVISFSYANAINKVNCTAELLKFTARSFKDISRIGISNPVIWHDIFMANRENLLKSIEEFKACLSDLESAVLDKDSEQIIKIIKDANSIMT